MKQTLKAATVLTWFNFIVWGLLDLILLMGFLNVGYLAGLAAVALLSAVPLNCWAALKLHYSIRHPSVPLNNQTPTGIRFVGFMALFFGISSAGNGLAIIRNAKDLLGYMQDQMKDMGQPVPEQFKLVTPGDVQAMGIFVLILGVAVIVNVVLNLRLLRWYYLVRKSDVQE